MLSMNWVQRFWATGFELTNQCSRSTSPPIASTSVSHHDYFFAQFCVVCLDNTKNISPLFVHFYRKSKIQVCQLKPRKVDFLESLNNPNFCQRTLYGSCLYISYSNHLQQQVLPNKFVYFEMNIFASENSLKKTFS